MPLLIVVVVVFVPLHFFFYYYYYYYALYCYLTVTKHALRPHHKLFIPQSLYLSYH